MWHDPEVRLELLASLPVAGRTGTLARPHAHRRRRPASCARRPERPTNASALSGFVGDRYVFSVLQNGYPVSWTWARIAQDRFAAVLAAAQ